MTGFEELVLSHVRRLTPRLTSEIHESVVKEWGVVNLRTTYRALQALLKSGHIRKEFAVGSAMVGYVRVRTSLANYPTFEVCYGPWQSIEQIFSNG